LAAALRANPKLAFRLLERVGVNGARKVDIETERTAQSERIDLEFRFLGEDRLPARAWIEVKIHAPFQQANERKKHQLERYRDALNDLDRAQIHRGPHSTLAVLVHKAITKSEDKEAICRASAEVVKWQTVADVISLHATRRGARTGATPLTLPTRRKASSRWRRCVGTSATISTWQGQVSHLLCRTSGGTQPLTASHK